MLNSKQSIILTGLVAVGIFIFGILDILDNFIVLTIITFLFFAIIFNLIYSSNKDIKETKQKSNFNK